MPGVALPEWQAAIDTQLEVREVDEEARLRALAIMETASRQDEVSAEIMFLGLMKWVLSLPLQPLEDEDVSRISE